MKEGGGRGRLQRQTTHGDDMRSQPTSGRPRIFDDLSICKTMRVNILHTKIFFYSKMRALHPSGVSSTRVHALSLSSHALSPKRHDAFDRRLGVKIDAPVTATRRQQTPSVGRNIMIAGSKGVCENHSLSCQCGGGAPTT